MIRWKVLFTVAAVALLTGCQIDQTDAGPSLLAYRERMLSEAQRPASSKIKTPTPREWRHKQEPVVRPAQNRAAATQPGDEAERQPGDGGSAEDGRRSLPTTAPTTQPAPAEIFEEIPDPVNAAAVFTNRADALRRVSREQRIIVAYERVQEKATEYLAILSRPVKRELGLAECIQRALQNNYVIRSESFNPAISQTQIVQAEAVFDAAFFLDAGRTNSDRPYPPQLATNQQDGWSAEGGIRKLLPTGMSVSTSVRQQRSYVDGIDGDVTPYNPAYDTLLIAQLRQPLLRGFGLDYNRRNITLARIGREVSLRRFEAQVRDTLLDVERAYWQLLRSRRTVAILAESVAQNWVTYRDLERLQVYKATPVQLNNARARYEQRRVALLETIRTVFDAEDRLKNLMNDPEFPLSQNIEILPTETLLTAPLVLDQFAEVRVALDRRSEIEQAKLNIESSRVNTASAKNETMPQLDLSFEYQVEGLDDDPGNSFDQMTTNRYRSYTVGVQFSQPLGNRGARARLREAQLRESQAVVDLQRVSDLVVEEVNAAVRNLVVRNLQIAPALFASQAEALNLRALQARTETVDPTYLETELNAVERLANARETLLRVVTDYTITVAELERAKGTLLDYNNIVVADAPVR